MTRLWQRLDNLWRRKKDSHQAVAQTTSQRTNTDEVMGKAQSTTIADQKKPLENLAWLAIAVGVSALVIGVRELSWLENWELQVYDQMVRTFAPSQPDPRILVVTIGEREYDTLKKEENIIKAIQILQANQPRTIALNLLMSDVSDKLSQAIAYRENLLVTCSSARSDNEEVPPPPGFDEIGFSDLNPDQQTSSQVLRRAVILEKPIPHKKCGNGYSFSALAAIMYLEKQGIIADVSGRNQLAFGSKKIHALSATAGSYERFDHGGVQTLISYRNPQTGFTQLSFQQLLNRQFSPELVRDKLVLIGITAKSVSENKQYYTPFTGDSNHANYGMSATLIHAQVTSNLIDIGLGERRPIWYWSDWGEYGWILLWSGIGAFVAVRISQPLVLMGGESAIALVIYGIGFVFFSQAGWIPVIPPILTLGLSGLATVIYKAYQTQIRTKIIILEVEKQQQAIAQLNALLQDTTSRLDAVPSDQKNVHQTGDLLLGNRYQITRILASGGFGCTYLAKDTQRPGTPTCVVKQLMPARRDTRFIEVARRLFAAEAEILQVLGKHEQIPNLLAYIEENQEFYLVQEYIAGRTLEHELHTSHPEEFVINLLKEILEILKFVHTHRVIHRDIKPGNIIRAKNNNHLVLIDFGAVKTIQPPSTEETELATVAIGTRGYAPPEQLAGHPRISSDIYAVGIIGIQALTGLQPQELVINPDTGNLQWQKHTQISPKLTQILEKMTCYYFGDRYQSANEVLEDLRQIK